MAYGVFFIGVKSKYLLDFGFCDILCLRKTFERK